MVNFALHSPDEVRIAANNVYLPSRQQLHYALVRIAGVSALLREAAAHALLVFQQSMQQIYLGMIVHSMVVFAATGSRIWFVFHREFLFRNVVSLGFASCKFEYKMSCHTMIFVSFQVCVLLVQEAVESVVRAALACGTQTAGNRSRVGG